MTATLSQPVPAAPASSLAAVPRAIWIALGTLALATAGLAGALVMRSIDSPEPATAQLSAQAQPSRVAGFEQQAPAAAAPAQQLQPAQPQVAQAPAQQFTQQPAPAPVQKPVSKPAAPKVVQQPAPAVAQAPVQQPRPTYTPVETQRAAICSTCGTVQAVQQVQEKGPSTGLGAVGGAVVGGLLGNQVGGGNGKKVMTVVGAAGGALAGHEIEKHVRSSTTYDVQVRMEDGSTRTFRRAEPIAVGTRVTVDGNQLRVGGGSSSPASVQPRTLQTSGQPVYGG